MQYPLSLWERVRVREITPSPNNIKHIAFTATQHCKLNTE